MIALFLKNRSHFDELKNHIKFIDKEFVYISSVKDILDRKFKGIVNGSSWYENKSAYEAYQFLRIRQPELFKDRN